MTELEWEWEYYMHPGSFYDGTLIRQVKGRTVQEMMKYKWKEPKMTKAVTEITDMVHHPAHYCEGRKYEPKDVIYDWKLDFNLGSAIKYISRCGRKTGSTKVEDLEKAIQYIEFELEAMRREESEV